MIKCLFNHLSEIENIIKKSDLVALFLDYDGTLVSFKDRPKDAIPSKELIDILKSLIKRPSLIVWIISGRKVEDITRMFSIKGLNFSGLHGLQIDFQNRNFLWDGAIKTKPIIDVIKKEVFAEFENEKAIRLRDKTFTLALNYRGFKGEIKKIKKRFAEIVSNYNNGKLEIIHGAKVLEVRPKGWNKGKAVKMILKEIPKAFPIYIGDDETDEDAFNYLNSINGITIIANIKKETNAKFYLKSQKEVFSFLNFLRKYEF